MIGNNNSLSGFNIYHYTLAITSANKRKIQQAITSAYIKNKRLTPTSNHIWFNILHMAITSATIIIMCQHNGITTSIK